MHHEPASHMKMGAIPKGALVSLDCQVRFSECLADELVEFDLAFQLQSWPLQVRVEIERVD